MNPITLGGCMDYPNDFSPSLDRVFCAQPKAPANSRQFFTRAEWLPTVFVNFRISPEILKPMIPAGLELELYQGSGVVSLVTVGMRGFRSSRRSIMGCVTNLIREQRFLNLRTYVKWRGEPGALFLHGWLSRPLAMPLPSGLLGLPYDFVDSRYRHGLDGDSIDGEIRNAGASYSYRATVCSSHQFKRCERNSISDFALERYAGFFATRGKTRIFRIWHAPWLQIPIEINISDMSLFERRHPWMKAAQMAGACLTQELPEVWLGTACSLDSDLKHQTKSRHHRLGALFEMP